MRLERAYTLSDCSDKPPRGAKRREVLGSGTMNPDAEHRGCACGQLARESRSDASGQNISGSRDGEALVCDWGHPRWRATHEGVGPFEHRRPKRNELLDCSKAICFDF